MGTVFFCLYALAAFIHIAAILCEKSIVREVSKISLMPLLMAFAIFQTQSFPTLIFAALLFSWFGDVLLIEPKKKLQLYLGIGSFFLAHIFYLITYTTFIYNVNIPVAISALLVVSVMECFIIKNLHLPKGFLIPITVYGTILGLLFLFSLQVLVNNKNSFSILLLSGSISFVISDITLAYFNTVKPRTKLSRSFVMASYIIAQAAIAIACINLKAIR
jgi:uncharacterized membrane protein YhhN